MTMNNNISSLIMLIKEAGKIMLSVNGVDEVTEKCGTANFVTEYDVKIQGFLIDGIKRIYPEAEFFSEEKENDAAVLDKEFCFIIDPIDGTTNFIHDLHLSAISVAMFSYGKPAIGIIYNPYTNELFYAEKGKGAFCNCKKISVSSRGMSDSVVAFGTSPYTKIQNGEKTMQMATEILFKCADLRRCGSATIDLSGIASGRYDLFFEIQLSPWDYAAGMLLIKEAGGIITDMKGDELKFDKPTPVIAGNPRAYAELLEIVKKYI